MANVKIYAPKLLKYEGTKYTNDSLDAGGPTKMGVTLGTWQKRGHDKDDDGDIDAEDVKQLDEDDFALILKIGYWDQCKADFINNQSIAEVFVDWYYMSGITAAKEVQKVLGTPPDGEVGKTTIALINQRSGPELHQAIKQARLNHIDRIIAAKPTQKRFEKGWKARINSFTYRD